VNKILNVNYQRYKPILYDTSKEKIVNKGKKLYMIMYKECARKNGEGTGNP
jgi:hypothetical protein